MKRVLLYFGSFNPIHIGHTAIANYAMASGIADELWLVVSPQNPFKPTDSLVSATDRVEMARLAIEQSDLAEQIVVSDVELHLPIPSFTIQTLETLWESYPEYQFSILMGSDNFASVGKWKESARILARCPLYVYDRPGCPFAEVPVEMAVAVHRLTEAPLLEIGSTRLRKMLFDGQYIPALLPPGVYHYIKTHGLYRINDKH
ncbi:MAG: nicotinate (nicotinamide) nucleotide adenylyltransferase [Rikenellaceae bacterium]|jgi:nicotinate-nucleotide adenylyltransferase|nr:nicotinate (nicotinamide) nucleotide adenylyltransferase [Rikenellaceae bacterium]